jgi:peptide-methionine (S)-S-oxide reductase
MEKATFAGGCFWCMEALFVRIKGVKTVISGYCGGDTANPSYEQVLVHNTGHAEAIQISFDPEVITYKQLLKIFFKLHDPTTLNQQGHDIGPQYRSAIFFHDSSQQQVALKAKYETQKLYPNQIVTSIEPYKHFYKAEDYHQNFYTKNPNQAYCRLIIEPKIKELNKLLPKYLQLNSDH